MSDSLDETEISKSAISKSAQVKRDRAALSLENGSLADDTIGHANMSAEGPHDYQSRTHLRPQLSVVTARGTEDGLVLRIDGKAEWEEILTEIETFLGSRRRFLEGGEVSVEWLERLPTREQSQQLESYLQDKFGISICARRKRPLHTMITVEGGSSRKREPSAVAVGNSLGISAGANPSKNPLKDADRDSFESADSLSERLSREIEHLTRHTPVVDRAVKTDRNFNREGRGSTMNDESLDEFERSLIDSSFSAGYPAGELSSGAKTPSRIGSHLTAQAGTQERLRLDTNRFNLSGRSRGRGELDPAALDPAAVVSIERERGTTERTGERAAESSAEYHSRFSSKVSRLLGDEVLYDEDANAKIVFGTMRSGQRIETPFSLVVIGDVNPGADLVAGGDIIVLGSLRGTAHAAAYDDECQDRIVFALQMQPMQLRIGSVISRGSGEAGSGAEIARVENRRIVVDAFIAKNAQGKKLR